MASEKIPASRNCTKCGVGKPWTNDFFPWARKGVSLHTHCKGCDARKRAEWRIANPERNREIAKRHRESHRTYYAERQRKWWRVLRDEAIEAYGGKCTCCGEAERDFLTLEHENATGKQHRAEVGGQYMVYVDLRRRGWPKSGFTILCYNCNMAQRAGGICPHKR